MLQAIFVIEKIATRIVGRIDIDALHFPRVIRLQRLQREEIVALDEDIIENIPLAPRRRVIRQARLLDEDTRLKLRPLILADPGEFETRFLRHAY